MEHYSKSIELDPTNIVYRNNRAGIETQIFTMVSYHASKLSFSNADLSVVVGVGVSGDVNFLRGVGRGGGGNGPISETLQLNFLA